MSREDRNRFYDDKNHVISYVEMREGIDGRLPIKILKNHLKPGSTVLELGMGPGNDLLILNETFVATGSDVSQAFIDNFKNTHPEADILLLDAVTLETNRKYDCIFSNKVLHHLTYSDLRDSMARQKSLLNPGGLVFHTFWKGRGKSDFQDLKFIRYQLPELHQIFLTRGYDVVEEGHYAEMNQNDSLFIIGKKR